MNGTTPSSSSGLRSLRPRYSFVIPAFNEERRLLGTLNAILETCPLRSGEREILVVDDGSTDNTAEVVRGFQQHTRNINLMGTGRRSGKGQAIRLGVSAARGETIVLCDADLQHSVGEVAKLEAALQQGADLAIGSRWRGHRDCASTQPLHRRMAGRIFHRLACGVLDLPFADTQCGLKAMTLSAAARVFPLLTVNGWGYDTELIHVALLHGLQVQEVDLRIVHDYSESKVRLWNDGWRTVLEVLRIRWRSACGAYRPLAVGVVESGDRDGFRFGCEHGPGAAAECLLQSDDGRLRASIGGTETAGTSRRGEPDHVL